MSKRGGGSGPATRLTSISGWMSQSNLSETSVDVKVSACTREGHLGCACPSSLQRCILQQVAEFMRIADLKHGFGMWLALVSNSSLLRDPFCSVSSPASRTTRGDFRFLPSRQFHTQMPEKKYAELWNDDPKWRPLQVIKR